MLPPVNKSGAASPHSMTLARHPHLPNSARFWSAPVLWRFRISRTNESVPSRVSGQCLSWTAVNRSLFSSSGTLLFHHS